MKEELKTLHEAWLEIERKMGLEALNSVKAHYYALWRKIEDLIDSRENWKAKYYSIKKEVKKNNGR